MVSITLIGFNAEIEGTRLPEIDITPNANEFGEFKVECFGAYCDYVEFIDNEDDADDAKSIHGQWHVEGMQA